MNTTVIHVVSQGKRFSVPKIHVTWFNTTFLTFSFFFWISILWSVWYLQYLYAVYTACLMFPYFYEFKFMVMIGLQYS